MYEYLTYKSEQAYNLAITHTLNHNSYVAVFWLNTAKYYSDVALSLSVGDAA